MNVIRSSRNRVTVIGGDPAVVAAAGPTKPVFTTTNIPRGVQFGWEAQPSNTRGVYFEYRTKVGASEWSSWRPTFSSEITRMLSATEVDTYGRTPTIYIETIAKDVYGEQSEVAAANGNALFLRASSDDVVASAIGVAGLGADVLARMFSTGDRLLSDCTESSGHYFASEAGADITSAHEAASTTLVGATAAATVEANAASGAAVAADAAAEIPVGEAFISSEAVDIKLNARLTAAERSNIIAHLLIDGSYEVYHAGNPPALSALGIANVQNKSSTDILGELALAHILATGVEASDIGAINTGLANAPVSILNSEITINSDGTLTGAGIGQVTLTGLGFGNVANLTPTEIIESALTASHINSALASGLDALSDGLSFVRMPAVMANRLRRTIWIDSAIATTGLMGITDLPVYGHTGPTYASLIVVSFVKLPEDTSLVLSCLAESTDAIGESKIRIEAKDFGDIVKETITEVVNTGGSFEQFDINLDVMGLTSNTLYCAVISLYAASAADNITMKGTHIMLSQTSL